MQEELYFEDFHPGQTFESQDSYWLTAREIIGFGERYDPQPFHIDETAGQNSFFNGLAASGWLTAAIAMRQRVQSIRVFGGMIGAGVEEMRWTKPVRPGDKIRTKSEIQHTRPLASRPTYGVVRCLTTVYNQRDEVVMTSITNFLAPLKAAAQHFYKP
jgi:acyl dehydratase